MKRCATCGSEYIDEYDACPRCAAATAKTNRQATGITCAVIVGLFVVLSACMYLALMQLL